MDSRHDRRLVSVRWWAVGTLILLLAGVVIVTSLPEVSPKAHAARATRSNPVETKVETFGQYTELDPPPDGMTPSLSPDEAVSAADRMNFAHASGVTATFGIFTGGGSTTSKHGDMVPVMDHVPAWVVTYANDCPTSPGRPLPSAVCTTDWHVVVDDATGKATDSWNQ